MSDAPKKKSKSGSKKSSKHSSRSKSSKDAPAQARVQQNRVEPTPPQLDKMSNLAPVQKDWIQREWIEHVSLDIKKITEFLNKFGTQIFNTLL